MSALFDSSEHFRAIEKLFRADEESCLKNLFPQAALPPEMRKKAVSQTLGWIEKIRAARKSALSVTELLSRYGLSSSEGVALMCLAEALLRIPDAETADALIKDKLSSTHWLEALGEHVPLAMNATAWALAISGRIVTYGVEAQNPYGLFGKLVAKLGHTVAREAIKAAMGWMAEQFVMGETISLALKRTLPEAQAGVRFSFDMLGEGARTAKQAEIFFEDYSNSIEAVGKFQTQHKLSRAPGVSIKLSALHPRYEMAQRERVLLEMLPKLVVLCEAAAKYQIPVTIDAEEADRLFLALELFAKLVESTSKFHWEGLGFAVQAYDKRAPAVIDYFSDLARVHGQRLGIRLVKGAYWDTEIKRAQERGWSDFSVFTRKAATDVSYLANAAKLLEQKNLLPVFGTHNAMTAAHILELATDKSKIEFQRLHGMGQELHQQIAEAGVGTCVYAPVGNHEVLLGYLVRRLIENGANSSFVHQLNDDAVPPIQLTADPIDGFKNLPHFRHPAILPAPELLPSRKNSSGLDLTDPFVIEPLLNDISAYRFQKNIPCHESKPNEVAAAFAEALSAFKEWSRTEVAWRAGILEKCAGLLEENRAQCMAFLINEGGKTIPDALSEVREAVDFCRYYAAEAREKLCPILLPGPVGEENKLILQGRGVFACISPWNFPLAIFVGQIAAALVAGNCVLAKPAPQTPQIAILAVDLFYKAGVPLDVLKLILGGREVGDHLIKNCALAGVAFTGSVAAARQINRALAAKEGPIVPLIAETGGQNALIVDSSALAEQVVDDVMSSAFKSAGQRCSALRLLCLPHSVADKFISLLVGALAELRLGDPSLLETDIGPVIDCLAYERLQAHVGYLQNCAKRVFVLPSPEQKGDGKFYFSPQIWEINSIAVLKEEVFGPILHIVRYEPNELEKLVLEINATGFGLTGGVHSRISTMTNYVQSHLQVGNLYINRSLIGAVVGVQPFGGEGNSGTGPKAGGPNYLSRFITEKTISTNLAAAGGNASLLLLSDKE